MIFSLPDYRHLSDATLERLREGGGRRSSGRTAGMLFNVLLLAGLWGVPLYGRWVVLSNMSSLAAPETIVGKWRTTDGRHFSITFTADGEFVLSWKDTIVETAHYWFNEGDPNEVVLSDLRERADEEAIADEKTCWFRVSLGGEKLSTTRALDQRERSRPGRAWQIKGERLALPGAIFERVK